MDYVGANDVDLSGEPIWNDMLLDMSELKERYTAVVEKIRQSALQANRDPKAITLVAVTKTWPVEIILAAYKAGMREFGENRAEELAQKLPLVEAALGSANDITWHAIGTLQSRKAKLVADHADRFHALDRLKVARKLSSRLQENGRQLPLFLEVNLSGEASKSGYQCENWENDATQLAALRNEAQQIESLPGLAVVGLMTMAPWGAPAEENRQIFRRTRQLAEQLQIALGRSNPLELSMGMTDDYEIAVAEGATHVRVGRAIFGSRH